MIFPSLKRINSSKLATVSGDQRVRLWDLSNPDEFRLVQEFRGHEKSIKAIEFQPGSDDVFATGKKRT